MKLVDTIGCRLVNKSWQNVVDEGPPLYGRFAHSLVTYKKNGSEVILIYGGFMPSKDHGKKPSGSDSLVEYRCNSSRW